MCRLPFKQPFKESVRGPREQPPPPQLRLPPSFWSFVAVKRERGSRSGDQVLLFHIKVVYLHRESAGLLPLEPPADLVEEGWERLLRSILLDWFLFLSEKMILDQ